MKKYLVEIGIRPWLADAGKVLALYEIEAEEETFARNIAFRRFREERPDLIKDDSWAVMDCVVVE